jgi:hypothetical protein
LQFGCNCWWALSCSILLSGCVDIIDAVARPAPRLVLGVTSRPQCKASPGDGKTRFFQRSPGPIAPCSLPCSRRWPERPLSPQHRCVRSNRLISLRIHTQTKFSQGNADPAAESLSIVSLRWAILSIELTSSPLLPACLYSRLAELLLCKLQGVSTGKPWFCIAGIWGRRRSFHHADDAAWPRHRALSRPADRDSQPRGTGAWLDPSVSRF